MLSEYNLTGQWSWIFIFLQIFEALEKKIISLVAANVLVICIMMPDVMQKKLIEKTYKYNLFHFNLKLISIRLLIDNFI